MVLHQIRYSCTCSELQAKRIGAIEILDKGLTEYLSREKMILEAEVEDELFQIPTIYLQNFSVSISEPLKNETIPKTETAFEAKGQVDTEKIDVFLNEKKKEEVNGHKVYTNRGTGSRGLELIQDFSKRRRAERKEDRDRHYKDRIDALEKIRPRN